MNPDNARTFRITAAAGTELAGPYSRGTLNGRHDAPFVPAQKQFTTRRALTAASRRSLGRVSVPVWGIPLSGPLPIVATVGRRPTVKLIGRIPIPFRLTPFAAT